jgi:hypothetical protein
MEVALLMVRLKNYLLDPYKIWNCLNVSWSMAIVSGSGEALQLNQQAETERFLPINGCSATRDVLFKNENPYHEPT